MQEGICNSITKSINLWSPQITVLDYKEFSVMVILNLRKTCRVLYTLETVLLVKKANFIDSNNTSYAASTKEKATSILNTLSR